MIDSGKAARIDQERCLPSW